jgi:hypothetical protein
LVVSTNLTESVADACGELVTKTVLYHLLSGLEISDFDSRIVGAKYPFWLMLEEVKRENIGKVLSTYQTLGD